MEFVLLCVVASWLGLIGGAVPIAGQEGGSDASLYNPTFFEGDIQLQSTNGKAAVATSEKLWSLGAVVYKVNDNVGCPSSPQCQLLMQAFDHYHANSCIRFKERTNEEDYVDIFFNNDVAACWSPVGRTGGEQQLSLGERCWYLGLVVHELGHAVGFWHEMNRPDRDNWIEIMWRNIVSGFASSFKKQDLNEVNTLGETFDYKSVMMYDELAFSKDGVSRTILPRKNGVTIGPIWRKPGLSVSDKRRLKKLYQCEGNEPLKGFPYDNRCNFNTNTCGFVNAGYPAWSWKNANTTEGYVFSTSESSGGNPGYFTSVNYHGLKAGDTRGPEGCVRFLYRLQGASYLKLSQIHLDRVTQLDIDSNKIVDLWESDQVTTEDLVEVPFYVTRPFKLIFHSYFENNPKDGLVALDNVEVLYSPCAKSEPTTTTTTTTAKPTTTTIKPTTTTTIKPTTTTTKSTTTESTTTTTMPATTKKDTYIHSAATSIRAPLTLPGVTWITLPPMTSKPQG